MRRAGVRIAAACLLVGALALAPLTAASASASVPSVVSTTGSTTVSTTVSAAADDGSGGDLLVTVPDTGQSSGGNSIANAQFRWGLNAESGSGAFAGGCNFLSAGRTGDVGSGGVVWGDGATDVSGAPLYRVTDGQVRIEKPSGSGEYVLATWAGRCLDADGNTVSASSVTSQTGNQVVIDGGTGTRAADGSLQIRWTGSFTVVFYGGMTYWSASDPVLTLDASGNGQVTATASGFAASMENLAEWSAISPREIVLAEIRGADVHAGGGFATLPEYLGVAVSDAGQVAQDATNSAYWGSFPASFVQFQKITGQAGYWLTTGGVRDRAKVTSTMYISYDAEAPVRVVPPATDSGGSGTPQNSVVQRPASASATSVPVPAVPVALPAYALADASTLLPESEGLVPGGLSGLANPLVLPLLGTALALSAAILAVLNLMQAFPWQRGARVAAA